jgi:carboxylesterase type B
MVSSYSIIFALWTLAASVTALPTLFPKTTVTLDQGTFVGKASGTVVKFYGIPYAKPPVGDLRFRLPVPNDPYTGAHQATNYGPSCPQQQFDIKLPIGLPLDTINAIGNTIYGAVFPDSEDCLTVNVVRPNWATEKDRLPVVAWIFGGGFELGSTSMYDGGLIVGPSMINGQPVIFVSMNYRLAAWGFLGGKEVKEAGVGNLGLHDQRLALKWIQKYITNFGGDPTRVTLWGESAGAISASLHMLTNGGNTEGLFRAAFMQSGAPIPVGPIENGQPAFDSIVQQVGCTGASDKLQCLREVPYPNLKTAVKNTPGILSYNGLNLAYLPRVDGVFLKDNPQQLVKQGSVARVPIVTGNCDDEGTLFSIIQFNVTTEADFRNYIHDTYAPRATVEDVDKLAVLYPSNPSVGSPFNTGILNAVTPQFKRLAAIQGDLVFQAPRRFFLQEIADKQDTWAYMYRRGKVLPILGTFHASDLLNSFGIGEIKDYVIRFTSTLNPNGGKLLAFPWPQWDNNQRTILSIKDGIIPLALNTDDFREDQISFLIDYSLKNPI